MKRQLIGWALSIAVALTASGNLALAAGGAGGGGGGGGGGAAGGAAAGGGSAGGGAANAGSGSTVGSNAGSNTGSQSGMHVGSNAGTHVGSNEGMNVGTQAPNAPKTNTSTPTNAGNNNNARAPINNPNLPSTQFQPGVGGNGGGWWGGGGGVISGDAGPSYDPNSVGSKGQPINAGQNPANGSTPPPTGQITNNGALTTSNVPPPANSSTINGMAMPTTSRDAQIEGKLVDLFSISQNIRPGTAASPAVSSTVSSASKTAAGPSNVTGAEAKSATAVPDGGATSSKTGTTESTASVRTTGGDTFGTYNHRGATGAPNAPTVPAASTANASSTASAGTVKTGSVEGKSLIITDSTPTSGATASATVTTPNFDTTTVSRQLTNGMPAAVLSNGQMYILACDPRQLASYAGQDVRVSGRLNSSGALIPDKLEVRQASGFRAISLSKPDMPSATASER